MLLLQAYRDPQEDQDLDRFLLRVLHSSPAVYTEEPEASPRNSEMLSDLWGSPYRMQFL